MEETICRFRNDLVFAVLVCENEGKKVLNQKYRKDLF